MPALPSSGVSPLSARSLWAIGLALHLCGCQSLRPSNDRNWSADQAVLSSAEVQGDVVQMHNIRNCDYRTTDNYTVHYYDKTFDLRELKSVDFIVVPFPKLTVGAHTFLSFGFADRDYLAVSIEIRKEQGESYQPLKAILNQFEIMYVWGDERDLIGLRTNFRLNDVYVYRTRATPAQVRDLFLDVVARTNKLAREPEFYNTVTNNCTTNIRRHVNDVSQQKIPYTYQVLLPGLADRFAYDRGLLDTDASFEATKARSRVNQAAYIYRDDPDFSVKIRQ